jgi:sugar (pentulose or hexulose) kinase
MEKTIKCVAFDLGASGGKVILGEFDGNRITISEVYRFSNNPILLGDHIYWDFLHLFEEVKKGLRLANKLTDGQIASIGVDTWGTDCALLDIHGHLLENPHCYRDARTNGMMEKAFQRMTREELYERTGVQFMQLNTIFQLLSIVDEDPGALNNVGTFLMVPDLFNYYLTGNKFCEFTNATTTQFYDPMTNAWNEPILNAMGIPRSIFPPIVQPGTIIGDLSVWLCEELGVKQIPVVAVATHDTPSAVSAVPSSEKDYAFLSSGTWTLLGHEEVAPVINKNGFKNNFSCYGGVCNSWLIWKNIQALWLLQECARIWAERGKPYSHEDLILMASQAKPFGPMIDTDDLVFLPPGDFPLKIAEYCTRTGQQPPGNDGAVVRSILESLAVKYRFTVDRLQEVVGKRLNNICVIGGGSRNWLLNRFTAEATGLTVKAGPAEATAIGNIMMQLMALKELDCLPDARKVVRSSFETSIYEACKTDAWEDAYGRYLEISTKSKKINP